MSKLRDMIKTGRVFRSLRVRIFIILMLIGTIPSFINHYGIMERYKSNALSVKITEVQTQMEILANHLITYHYLANTNNEVVNVELSQLSNLYDGRVMILDDNLKIIKDTYGISEGKILVTDDVIKCFNNATPISDTSKNGYIVITVPIEDRRNGSSSSDNSILSMMKNTSSKKVIGAIVTSVSTSGIDQSYDFLNNRALIIELLIAVAVFGISWFLSKSLLKPFDKISESINAVKNGFTDEKIKVNDYLETEHIGESFNQMMGRMKVLDDSRQEFVSNVSHELKTPLTSMKVLADSLLAQEDVPNELYKEFMTDIADEIDRENKIITDLLALVKMTRTSADLNVEPMDINAILELTLKRLGPIAARANVKIIFESRRKVNAEVDEVKLTLAISNLVENAIKYNVDDGWVKVILDADHQYFTVEVSDSGIGIPQESLEHIYERFYRVDKSHSREIGGTGLGLAITRNAVLMHKGSIKVNSEEGKGTTFIIKIPLSYISS